MTKQKPKKVAIYARVSTTDKDQNPETQLMPLKKFAELREWDVHDVYVDEASGRHEKKDKRPEFNRMMSDARKRKFDVLLVFRYNRFARSTQDLITALKDFEALGIDFFSYHEQIDTTTSHGKFFFTVIAGFAQLESDMISENVKDGMARAKAEGKRISRPPLPDADKQRIIETWKDIGGIRATSRQLEMPYPTVRKVVSEYKRQTGAA